MSGRDHHLREVGEVVRDQKGTLRLIGSRGTTEAKSISNPNWGAGLIGMTILLELKFAPEFASCEVEFSEPLMDTDGDLRGFEVKDAEDYNLTSGRSR